MQHLRRLIGKVLRAAIGGAQRFMALVASTAALAAVPVAAADRPLIPVLDAAAVNANCASGLKRAAARLDAIRKIPVTRADAHNVLHAWNDAQIVLEDAVGPIDLHGNVHPDKTVRDAAEACQIEVTKFTTELFQDRALFARVKALRPAGEHASKFRKDLIESFEDTGVALPPAKRARAGQILQKIEELRQEFDRNLRDDKTRLTFAPDELKGLPEDYIARAKRDQQGNFLLGFEYPEYIPFMRLADNEAARKRYYIGFNSRGGKRNIELMDRVMRLRHELAQLYGLRSYAHFVTRRRMVENPQTVNRFLADVKGAVQDVERREMDELRQIKARLGGDSAAALGRWDVAYYQEKLRKSRYAVDQEALRKYFPSDGRLYAIRFNEIKVPVWHPDVRYFDVLDADSGTFLGGVYIDVYPREGKYMHAAAWPVRVVSRIAGRTPISALVANFNRNGLNHEELETLLHEFGHVLHGVLSMADFNPQGGTNTVVDFVEAPSQMFEEWARRPESLALMQQVCKSCPVMDAALIRNIDEARRYGSGVRYARQHMYATFDMALAGPKPPEALATWDTIESDSPLGHVAGTMFPASFAHIMAQYGAGYYGYMWSEVLALDMLSAFGDNIMNPQVGKRFRDVILANGGQIPAKQLVETFLGRSVSNQAFFAEITGRRGDVPAAQNTEAR